jgi:hypothetical protein
MGSVQGVLEKIFKIFSPKNLAKILPFLLLVYEKNMIITLFFEKNANFFAESWQKSQKIIHPWSRFYDSLSALTCGQNFTGAKCKLVRMLFGACKWQ